MQVPLFRFAIIITFLVHPHPGILGGMIKRPQAERPAHAKASLTRLYDPMGQLHTHTHTHNSHHRTSRPMGQLHTFTNNSHHRTRGPMGQLHTHKLLQQPPRNQQAHGSAAHTHNSHHRTSVGPWVSRTPTHTHTTATTEPAWAHGSAAHTHNHHRTSWAHGSAAHTLTQQPPQNPWAHGSAAHTHTQQPPQNHPGPMGQLHIQMVLRFALLVRRHLKRKTLSCKPERTLRM